MPWAPLIFILSVPLTAGLLVGQLMFLSLYSDLKRDFINPYDFCRKINTFSAPEMACQAALSSVFLLSGQWAAFLLNVPLLLYNARLWSSGAYRLHSTDIYRTRRQEKRVCLARGGFYLVSVLFYLYSMITILIHEHDKNYVEPGPPTHRGF